MSFNPFGERKVRVTVTVTRPDSSGQQVEQTYVFTQHRMRIAVRTGGQQFGNAHLMIYGVPLASMNQIARLWLEAMTPQATDTVAIDVFDGKDFIPFFAGQITWSAVDASGMPEVALVIEANSAMTLMNQPASPYANPGPVALSDALTAIVGPAGFTVDYFADPFMLADVRVTGSPMEQVSALMRGQPTLTWHVALQRLVIRAANAPINSNAIAVSIQTGLMAPPVYSTSGLTFDTLFNPQITLGCALDIQTSFDFVNRTLWVAAVLAHQLEPNVPRGRWTTSVGAQSYGPKGNNQ
jgi:hypothetical protein